MYCTVGTYHRLFGPYWVEVATDQVPGAEIYPGLHRLPASRASGWIQPPIKEVRTRIGAEWEPHRSPIELRPIDRGE